MGCETAGAGAGAGAGEGAAAAAARALRILSACVSGRAGAGASSFLYSCASASSALPDEFRCLRCVDVVFAVANCRVAQKTQMSRVDDTCLVSRIPTCEKREVDAPEVLVRDAYWQ